jgi:3-isopropylmalate/(R)-2-methylmalate dehydratase small subunit
MTHLGGRAWVFGDNVDTDQLAPGLYMKRPIEELARHCLEGVDPAFAANAKPGDVVVAGRNFGMGSSREQAAQALRHLGIAAVLAPSFAGIFYRNAVNLGLLAMVCAEARHIAPGDRVVVDADAATAQNLTKDETYALEPVPPHLLEMVRDGGLVEHLEKKRARETRAGDPS